MQQPSACCRASFVSWKSDFELKSQFQTQNNKVNVSLCEHKLKIGVLVPLLTTCRKIPYSLTKKVNGPQASPGGVTSSCGVRVTVTWGRPGAPVAAAWLESLAGPPSRLVCHWVRVTVPSYQGESSLGSSSAGTGPAVQNISQKLSLREKNPNYQLPSPRPRAPAWVVRLESVTHGESIVTVTAPGHRMFCSLHLAAYIYGSNHACRPSRWPWLVHLQPELGRLPAAAAQAPGQPLRTSESRSPEFF